MATVPLSRPLRSLPRAVWFALLGAIISCAGLPAVRAQAPSPTSQAPQAPPADTSQNAPKPEAKNTNDEIVAHDSPATFKVRVNLVLVRVVVRDGNGKVVSNLKKEDFQLADNHKPQVISSFSVETPSSHPDAVKIDQIEATPEGTAVKAPELPERFVALYFDDLHLSTSDVTVSRQAAMKLFGTMQAGDRFAISTSSGQAVQDFTANRENLEDTLKRIVPRLLSQSSPTDCPPMTNYEAYEILDVRDPTALQVAMQDVQTCIPGADARTAQNMAEAAAQRKLDFEESQLQITYQNLEGLIRRMSAMPGQRIIAMMSPGFFVTP